MNLIKRIRTYRQRRQLRKHLDTLSHVLKLAWRDDAPYERIKHIREEWLATFAKLEEVSK